MRVRTGVTVVGLGNWGSSLVAALRASDVPVLEVVHVPGHRAGKESVALEKAALDARVLWLCVPDRAITEVASEIVRCRPDLRGQVVVHSSGALSSAVLQAAAEAGAAVASVHPLMSFPSRRLRSVRGAPFGVEAEGSAQRRLFALVRTLGGRPFALSAAGKAMYHVAGMFASPLLTSLLAVSLESMHQARVELNEAKRLLGPIARVTVENVVRDGVGRSFSGPVARGDLSTIKLHLRALEAHPLLAQVYKSLVMASLKFLPSQGTEALHRLLTENGKVRRARPSIRDRARPRPKSRVRD